MIRRETINSLERYRIEYSSLLAAQVYLRGEFSPEFILELRYMLKKRADDTTLLNLLVGVMGSIVNYGKAQ